jgi:transposase
MPVALIFYGYATGAFSSRKLAQAMHDSIALRYICAKDYPGTKGNLGTDQ